MTFLFWLSLFLLFYAFAGYPLALRLLGALRSRSDRRSSMTGDWPTVSVVLSVFDEEAVIASKIANFQALDYPPDRLEMIVVSDACTDRTEEIVRRCAGERVRLLPGRRRRGKTRNLNIGARRARGEILVFTDANSMLDPGALKALVRPFADRRVGLVSGRSLYLAEGGGTEEVGGAYRRYEEWLKSMESRIGGIVGADGAIYALRRELYKPLPPEYINDFVHTIQAVLQERRAVSAPGAICRETVEGGRRDELRRQVRMMTQSWRIYFSHIGPLLRKKKFLYAWELTSHKALRWLTLPLMALLGVASAAKAASGPGYLLLLGGLLLFVLLAFAGRRRKDRWSRLAHGFVMVHYAALVGLVKYLGGGEAFVTWNPRNS